MHHLIALALVDDHLDRTRVPAHLELVGLAVQQTARLLVDVETKKTIDEQRNGNGKATSTQGHGMKKKKQRTNKVFKKKRTK